MKSLTKIVALAAGLSASAVQAQDPNDAERIADVINTTIHANNFTDRVVAGAMADPLLQTYREEQIKQDPKFLELEAQGALCAGPLEAGARDLAMGGYLLTLGTDTIYRQGLTSLSNGLELAESCSKLAAIAYQDPIVREDYIASVIGKEIYGHRQPMSDWGLIKVIDRNDAIGSLEEMIERFKDDAMQAAEYRAQLGPYLLSFDNRDNSPPVQVPAGPTP